MYEYNNVYSKKYLIIFNSSSKIRLIENNLIGYEKF